MPDSYTVVRVPGLKPSTRRTVALLQSDTDRSVNAVEAMAGLNQRRRADLLARFDYWIDGGKHHKYFHGWPNEPDYKECFTFKWYERGVCHRLYGFLYHPYPQTNRAFQVCVLASHVAKTKWLTDKTEKDLANTLSSKPGVVAAIRGAFPETDRGKRQWVN